MAYDQSYYQQQPQRPYNGPAGQRPRPQQQQQQQQYPPHQGGGGGYDQYPQDGYYDDGYDDGGYAQDYQGGYQDAKMNGARGNGYAPPQNQYPPPRQESQQQQQQQNQYPPPRQESQQQEYYGEPRGGGRGMPPPNRGRGAPMQQRPGTADGYRGGYDQRGGGGGGYPAGPPPPNGASRGRGSRPAPLDRAGNSDPGAREPRRPLKTPPISPEVAAWDNPFPTFPNTKKKTSRDEEQQIIAKMMAMEVGEQPQGRPRGAGSKGSQDRYVPSQRERDDYAISRPSVESQRSLPSRLPPTGQPQGYPDQRRGPPGPGPAPRQNGYQEAQYDDRGGYDRGPASPDRGDFGPPGRSMTMPNQSQMGQPPVGRQAPMSMDPIASERPYNGPIGRGMPPRPSTATGARPPQQRNYPNQAPAPAPAFIPAPAPVPDHARQQSSQYLADPYAYDPNGIRPGHESVSDFYDAYYEPRDAIDPRHSRSHSHGNDAPPFEMGPGPSRGQFGENQPGHRPSIDSTRSYQAQTKPLQSQPDFRGRVQPQAAVFDMVDEAPDMPNQYPQSYPEDRYNAPQNGQYNQPPGGQQGPVEPPPNAFPPRSTSASTGRSGPSLDGLPSGPKQGFVGLPSGPSPNAMPVVAPNAHPPPVRAGLIPNSVANLANNKPPPVRNYNNINPSERAPAQPAQQPQPATLPAPPPGPPAPPPVTLAEIESLKAQVSKINLAHPADQAVAMTYVKKLVEACDVLVPKIADQKQRNKAREQHILTAHKQLKKLIAAQNTEAMFYMADCYGRGSLGLEADNKEAFSLYQSAAKGNHAAAAYRTAVCCELGNEEGGGTRKDPLKAIQWYKRAAILGDIPATYKMGMIQLKGLLGQPKDLREAVKWLKAAADKSDIENPHALHELGLLYEAPQLPDTSIVRDEQYSFRLFQQAADLGYKFSQFRMGCAFEYGLFNCPINPRDSIMWYSRAAVQEEHQSELALSGWYLTGSEGVLQQSDTEAYLWARRAAMAGNAKAEYAMGYFTEVGIGIQPNLEDAKRWYWRAAAQNFPKARERLEDLKKGGKNAGLKARERISRSKVGKQQEGECAVM